MCYTEELTINERFPERIGKQTSSRIKVILNAFKAPTYYASSNKDKAGQIKHPGGWSDGAKTYARKLAIERAGYIEDGGASTFSTRWGKEWEDTSRQSYAEVVGHKISPETFVLYNDFIGSTPDGLIGRDGIFETKCLQIDAHLVAFETPDHDHVLQCQHQLFGTKRRYAHLVYFHPHAPNKKMMRKVYVIEPDLELHGRMLRASEMFEVLVRKYYELYKD